MFRENTGHANGNTIDRQGRLITCEQGARRVTRTEHDGSITVLATHWQGKRLNSPDDVVVRADARSGSPTRRTASPTTTRATARKAASTASASTTPGACGLPHGTGCTAFTRTAPLLGKLLLPEPVANLAFGGARRNDLFTTAGGSLYSLQVTFTGARY